MWKVDLIALTSGSGKRPGPMAQRLNAALNREPYNGIAFYVYWGMIWILAMPLVGFTSFGMAAFEALRKLYCKMTRGEWSVSLHPHRILAKDGVELAVLVTGCDTGIGRELALRLAKAGFTVFAGCLKNPEEHPEETQAFRDNARIRPLWMDVTKQEDVDRAYRAVADWAAFRDTNSDDGTSLPRAHRRHFYALVNNAGIVRWGYADWCDVSDYEMCFKVNCLGPIRTCKAFLDIFQKQAIKKQTAKSGDFYDMRIVNVNSMAGQVQSGFFCLTPYETSKNAAASFTDGLRLELGAWGIDVVSVNPSFHETPMADPSTYPATTKQRVWDNLTREKRDLYGTDFFDRYTDHITKSVTSGLWELETLLDTMVDRCLLCEAPPPAQVCVGLDAQYMMWPLRMLPPAARQFLPLQIPAALQAKAKAATTTAKDRDQPKTKTKTS